MEKKADASKQSADSSSITLSKNSSAICGIGEKFAANPVTCLGSMSVPIASSPRCSSFGPQLNILYHSYSCHGPFGFGWSLSIPSITRKTDKGLPKYSGMEKLNVFMLSSAEDLVPILDDNATRFKNETTAPAYITHRHRPRMEELFARLERWMKSDDDVCWCSVSKDNITTRRCPSRKSSNLSAQWESRYPTQFHFT